MRIIVDAFEDRPEMVSILAKLLVHYMDELSLMQPRLKEVDLRENSVRVQLTPSRQRNGDSFYVKTTFTIEHAGSTHELKLETSWGIKELQDMDTETNWLWPSFNTHWCKYLLRQVSERAA